MIWTDIYLLVGEVVCEIPDPGISKLDVLSIREIFGDLRGIWPNS